MGGGYYDRSLARRKRLTRYKRPRIIGLAFDAQRVASIDVQPWDVPLDAVLTESGLHTLPADKRRPQAEVSNMNWLMKSEPVNLALMT